MLFTESQLQRDADPFAILDEATYLTEEEATIQPQMVSIVENNRLQAYVVDFNGIYQLAESANIDYLDAAVLVLEQEGIDPSAACFAIDEARLIESPELAQLGSIVVRPLSEHDSEYVLTELLLESFISESENWDEIQLASLLEMSWNDIMKELNIFKDKYGLKDKDAQKAWLKMARFAHPDMHINSEEAPDSAVQKVKDFIIRMGGTPTSGFGDTKQSHSGGSNSGGSKGSGVVSKVAGLLGSGSNSGGSKGSGADDNKASEGSGFGKKIAIGASIVGALAGGLLAYRHYKDQPKSAIAKRIAALRNIYSKFMQRAQSAPNEGIKNRLKHVAAKILRVVDKLLALLQRKADHR